MATFQTTVAKSILSWMRKWKKQATLPEAELIFAGWDIQAALSSRKSPIFLFQATDGTCYGENLTLQGFFDDEEGHRPLSRKIERKDHYRGGIKR